MTKFVKNYLKLCRDSEFWGGNPEQYINQYHDYNCNQYTKISNSISNLGEENT
jgi:hypothetical protein